MTLRTTTLTAVAALAVALSGGAVAQDNGQDNGMSPIVPEASETTGQQDPAPASAPEAEAEAPADAEAEAEPEAAQTEAADEAAPEAEAEEAPAEEMAEPEATETEAPADEAETSEEAATEEAPADEAGAAEDEATEDPATDEAADEGAADEGAADEAGTEDAVADEAEEGAADEAPADEAGAEEAADQAESAPADAAEEVAAEDATAETVSEDAEVAVAPETDAPEESGGHGSVHIEDISFSFEGPFGKFDQHQLQRGLQVYTEICAACHGLRYVPLRTLSDPNGPGLPEAQVRAYAEDNVLPIFDPELDEERPRVPTDHFPTVEGEGMGPDLSLMAKARAGFHGPYGTGLSQLFRGIGGPEYIHAILVGYDGEEKMEAGAMLYHNTAFDGGWIQMPNPLMDDMIEYEDGTPATVDQMSRDVSAFLMWTAEPKMMDRKQVGLVSVLFLVLLGALLYLTNKRLWHPIKHRDENQG